ncbi:MFS transporter family glucose-6-phosphate receptor UhpC [Sporomusa sphaeroides]|uniref:Regulatory protein UhpC n=1 Tax=Sporomusa sphaeroides DSM 2875 TaxID=1337886 RepID=A0ABM9W254_9FIRM|nr:MFS transporter family glucose-6-phosphate receptor UhpC [Sporomusa sphaeroides]OLS56101.1 regulatory protein UhpC [Sporomusa sphaeroides DSM 2875]CVK19257.1 Regulatory protein UhpC [Sporomusa sphaeroides DSM 2875]
MFYWLKPAESKPVTKSQAEIDKDYNYWRWHVMASIWVGYAIFYFTRNSYKSIMPKMLEDLHLQLSDVGMLSTIFYIVYGSSRFIGGIMSDKSNPRYFMGIGLILTGIVNILFGLSSSVTMFALLWGLNAFFQGWGWPPCTKILTTWYSRNERGFWWALCNTSHNVGGAIIPILAAYLAVHYGWRYGMIVPGIIGIVFGILVCIFLRDRPESMGLPKVGEWRNDELEMEQVKKSASDLSTFTILRKYILTNKFVWLLALSYVLVYVVRIGVNDWANLFLVKSHGVDLVVANSAISMLEIGGFIGTIAAGWGSDKLFKGNRIPMNIIFMLGIMVSVAALWLLPLVSYWAIGATFFFIGFFIFGPQMLTGMAAAEVAHKEYAGTATGFVGLFGYMGAALTGLPVAKVIETWGWDGFFMVMAVASLLSALIIVPIMKPKK